MPEAKRSLEIVSGDVPAVLHGSAFVPTMGALHDGHVALMRTARDLATAADPPMPVLVSVFVNPTQFDDPADLARYPRTLEADCERANEAGADAVYAPPVDVVYPPDADVRTPVLPDVATRPGLEDRHRPGHFAGVCQVVARLFDLVQPRIAVFGEKDWQQLQVITAMVDASGKRWGHLHITACPTVRADDGLALSSRNARLSEAERSRALGIFRALSESRQLASVGRPARRIEEAMRAILVKHQLRTEYAVVREATTLMPVDVIEPDRNYRSLIAARVGSVRLIDNMEIGRDE